MKVDSLFRDISVVIPTFNRPKTLQSTIESYLSGNALPKQIIVVDQSQYPFDPYFISNWRGVEIKVIHQPIPSLTLARNIGARTSDCDVILFSDDDVLVNVDSISILTDVMDDKSYALVAGVDIDENGVWGSLKKGGC